MNRNQISKIGVLAIVLLAPSLGGATESWCQSLILLLIALLVAVLPPQRIDLPVALTGSGLLAMVGISFLPNHWFSSPAWRLAASRVGIELPTTNTPQPWVTLHALLLLIAGLLWFCWVTDQTWSTRDRRFLARCFCLGAALLAIVAIVAYHWNIAIPLWLQTERRFGPFPNRNQTADFLAISALVSMALAHEGFHRQCKKWSTAVWGLTAAVLVWGLVLSYSRAGVGIFFMGVAIWVLKFSRSYKKIALGLVFILVLLTGFFLFGGETLERLRSYNAGEFRFKIWRDSLSMIGSSPWIGTGLGNFEFVFPFFRNISLQQQRIIHPESDWLWLSTEGGLPSVLFVFCAVAATLRRVFPFEPKTARSLRAACATGAIMFMVHGFMDVSAHRLGTVLPAIFVLGLALKSPGQNQLPSLITAWGFRLVALGVFILALPRIHPQPDEKQLGRDLLEQRKYGSAVSHLTLALQKTPLDWEAYYFRGTAQASVNQWIYAVGDFRRANLLEPISRGLPVAEAALWLMVRPPLAISACREALRRCQFTEKGAVFAEILDAATPLPEITLRLGDLAKGSTELELAYLPFANVERTDQIVARLLPQAYRLNPAWQKVLYTAASRRRAEQGDFEEAFKLARMGISMPSLPKLGMTSLEESQRQFTADPSDFAAAFLLYSAQMREKNFQDALFTLEKVNEQKNSPAYIQLLTADLYAQFGRWEKAWEHLNLYRP